MTQLTENAHVYHRTISPDERSSLSVVASLVPPGSCVLDLGTGSGSLGHHLTTRQGCVVDGVTYNQEEADLASQHYRRLEVADLETCDLASLFGNHQYDAVVCADVLEHIRYPERIIEACHKLLKTDGRLIISIPNAAYAGLSADLLSGEFKYRAEGLLDRTHLRFFTRKSIQRLLSQLQWNVLSIDTIERPLNESEFETAFDDLPPSVARYLLVQPDALTYQFVISTTYCSDGGQAHTDSAADLVAVNTAAKALFSAQVYVEVDGHYSEEAKLTCPGVIGQLHQTLSFELPVLPKRITGLRLDPADRPGFLHLHAMRLITADQQTAWRWNCTDDSVQTLEQTEQHDIVMRPPWPGTASMPILLCGDDPWFVLPIPLEAVNTPTGLHGGRLEVDLGWPMSADYLALSELMAPLQRRALETAQRLNATHGAYERLQSIHERDAAIQQQCQVSLTTARQQRDLAHIEIQNIQALTNQLRAEKATLDAEHARLKLAHDQTTGQLQHLQTEKSMALEEQGRLVALNSDLTRKLEHTSHLSASLSDQNANLTRQNALLTDQNNQQSNDIQRLQTHLQWIENSTVFRMTRPLVKVKMWVDKWRRTPSSAPMQPSTAQRAYDGPRGPSHPVDVIVPVYKGLADTVLCIESVLSAQCATPWRLVIINDCSPEPEVTAWLRNIQTTDPRITLLENEENLGFVGTVNRGMALSRSNDVLLLNSDAEVANDWLDRIARAAYSDHKVASVTPFSNNATICSYPRFCEDNELVDGLSTAAIDRLFAQANAGAVIDVPTGVGFCMYIRRDSLDEVGLFDVANFGKGYGEENDFCCRTAAAGWRNLHVLDTFVHHSGGVSFGAHKRPREIAAMETLRRLHPQYERDVHQFVAKDPAQHARRQVDLARIRNTTRPVVLAVMHDRGGGTERHVRELAAHLGQQARVLTLQPVPGGQVSLRMASKAEALDVRFDIETQWDDLVVGLKQLGVAHVHFHHLIGHHPRVMGLPELLDVAYDFTAHDYYLFCPQISLTNQTNAYCGEKGIDQCNACLRWAPAPGGISIETWRAQYEVFLQAARHVYTPSVDAAERFARVFSKLNLVPVPHTDVQIESLPPARRPRLLADKQALKVVVIGAMSAIKGADILEQVAVLSASQGLLLDFHLLGYAYRSLRTRPEAALTVHGQYDDAELLQQLTDLQPDLVWFPAQWPETYSYTLSAALQSGLPVVGPDLGAFAERLQGRAWSWVQRWDLSGEEWVHWFQQIRLQHFNGDQTPDVPNTGLSGGIAMRPWRYHIHYLEGISVRSPDAPDTDDLSSTLLDTSKPSTAGLASQSKQRILRAVIWLRSTPALREVAKRVPLRWQTRVKTWLQS